jgi:AcrR family transcriptional regulator
VLDAGEGIGRRRDKSGASKARQLLDAARRSSRTAATDAAGVEDITARANVAVGAFYVYFRSKRQLLIELMNLLLQRLQSIELTLPAGADVRRGLRTFLRAALRADRENYGVVRAWNEAASTDAELAKMRGVIEGWTQRRVRGVFVSVGERLGTAPPADLDTFARIIDRYLDTARPHGDHVRRRIPRGGPRHKRHDLLLPRQRLDEACQQRPVMFWT